MGNVATGQEPRLMALAVSRSIFFGWKVVITAFVVATFTFGVGFYGPSVFLNILHQQHGWPVSSFP